METKVVGKPTEEQLKKALNDLVAIAPRVNRDCIKKIVEASYQTGYLICLTTKIKQDPPDDISHSNWTFNFGKADIFPALDEHARLLTPQTREDIISDATDKQIKGDFEQFKEEAEPGDIVDTTKHPIKDELDIDEGIIDDEVKE